MKITDLRNYTVTKGNVTLPEEPEQAKTVWDKAFGAGKVVSDFVGGKGVTDLIGAGLANTMVKPEDRKFIEYPKAREVAGSALQLGALAIPGAGLGAGLARKAAIGAATGYALDVGSKLQNKNETLGSAITPGIGTAVGAGLPVAGAVIKPATAIVGRLLKGLGSGLSGVSSNTIEQIVNNPQKAVEVSKKLVSSGNAKILEENARQIINGVSKIRQEARQAFGEGLQQLKAEDINPKTFRTSIQSFLDANGISVRGNMRNFNVEFSDPKNLKVASGLIDELSKTKLDGLSLRKILNKVENTRYKTATSDERLAFNAFTKDFAEAIKGAITGSTDKLNELNKAFSSDMQLAEATQNILGKVKFKNLPEVVKASQKLEGLFSQKGLAPEVVDSFLTRIGANPAEFRTSEAVRQIGNKATGANTKGLSIGEITQQATSAIVTPNMVKNLSIVTGLAKEKLIPFLNSMKPAARNILIDVLLQANQQD